MKLLGLEVTSRSRAVTTANEVQELRESLQQLQAERAKEVEQRRLEVERIKLLQSPTSIWSRIFEQYPGQWQQDVAVDLNTVLSYGAVFACIGLISRDIGKLRIKLVEQQASGIWKEISNAAHSPVLRKPNSTQTRIKFIEQWIISKMIHGNTYLLKTRDNRGVVTALRILDPTRVTVLISESGDVFYRLRNDYFNRITEVEITVPAREIIHDVHFTPEHPLVGVSPIGACGLAASQGLKIQEHSEKFFTNRAVPGGMLTAPGAISNETATRLKEAWEENYGGDNIGKTAVAGDGLEYKAFAMTAVDSQLVEQLKMTAEDVCRAFGVPAYKIGVGQMPAYNNIEALAQAYYSDTLQELIECIELLLDEGLELPANRGVEFDLDGLLRMDTATRFKTYSDAIGGSWMAPNEARLKEDMEPVPGGESPLSQQQYYSLEALGKRDQQDDPFATAPAPQPEPAADEDEETDDDTDADEEQDEEEEAAAEEAEEKFVLEFLRKELVDERQAAA